MTDSSNDFAQVVLAKINPEEPLPTDVYILIDGKYIKFRKKGDYISAEKYNLFISKNVKTVYISNEQINDFLDWLASTKDKVIDEAVEIVGEENRPLVEKQEELKEKVYETFFDEELTPENVRVLQDQVSELIEHVSKNPISAEAIAKLAQQNQSVAEHSVNVANLAVFLAMALGHGHQYVLENVYMGGLFHDYGKAKIPASILENVNNALYSQAIQNHPEKGVEIVRKIGDIPEPVFTIIYQHHEQYDGSGYPRGISGSDIYELSEIVSIANIFDNIATENKNRPSEMYKKAIKVIEFDRGKFFDPKVIPRVLDALKLAFKDRMN